MTRDINNQVKAAIIDYGSGNLHSAHKAFVKALEQSGLKGEIIVTSDPNVLRSATHIVLPGVGAFGDCISGLKAVNGMIESLENEVLKNKKPFLGICVGMQMLAEKGFEDGEHKGLGWLSGVVKRIPAKNGLRIPQMGWNSLNIKKNSKLLDGIKANDDVYFVHSYYFETEDSNILADVGYGTELTAAVERDNIFGVQFHPEKSQKNGLRIISNFLSI